MNAGSTMSTRQRPSLAMEPERMPCPQCSGRGWVAYPIRERDGSWWDTTEDCPVCLGSRELFRDGTPVPKRKKEERR